MNVEKRLARINRLKGVRPLSKRAQRRLAAIAAISTTKRREKGHWRVTAYAGPGNVDPAPTHIHKPLFPEETDLTWCVVCKRAIRYHRGAKS